MRIIKISCPARALLVLFCLVMAAGTAVSAAETVDRIVAIVNDDIIRLKELESAMNSATQQMRAGGSPARSMPGDLQGRRNEVLNHLINRTLADQVIEAEGISVSSAEIDQAIDRMRSMNDLTEEELKRSLKMNGLDMETYREEIRRQILQSKLVNRKVKSSIVITDADIREYYENHPEKYREKTKYRLKNIFMGLDESAGDNERETIRQRMAEAMAELENGKPFEAVAEKYSEGSNASKGGELGAFSLDELQEELQPAIKNLSAGETSPIVETEQGFQIFYLEEMVKPPGESLEKVSGDIRKLLYDKAVDKKFQEWIKNLRKDAHIKIID